MTADNKYRIFILGAGFSKAAGIPLADELWKVILKRCDHLTGRASKLNDDIEAYLKYCYDCKGVKLKRDTINFEEFLGYLDIEHFLGLRGKDTWSEDGNEGQVVVKTLIGEFLSGYMPKPGKIPQEYIEFAKRLEPNDYIFTFNYDTLLERALDEIGKSYRLFPYRYESINKYGGTIDSSKEEVVILKYHGSIDWFSKKNYKSTIQAWKEQGYDKTPDDVIFGIDAKLRLSKLVDGPRFEDDPLNDIYRVSEIEHLYGQNIMFQATPYLLTPSINKIIYANRIGDFWRGLGDTGYLNFGMSIIGYSLPAHDVYASQIIYSLVKNYQEAYWNKDVCGHKKTPLILVDYQKSLEDIEKYKEHYRFVDYNKAELCMDGFNLESIERIFHDDNVVS
ncbi:MAG TPA: SIR2 family protein [Clostridiales bacterium]|nr:SIR2 family protein [Clostridiales bacterium]HQP70467.1 SIR2 family protein [Clostridiales bacterium]